MSVLLPRYLLKVADVTNILEHPNMNGCKHKNFTTGGETAEAPF